MKKLAEVVEVENEGLVSLLGERVTLFCANYFYVGDLTGVNDDCVRLDNPAIVYETGPWTDKKYKDEQPLGIDCIYVRTDFIESFGVVK